jgi:glycerol-3-phosphate dehydrogenase
MFGERPDIEELSARRWDVIVIGGGITGAGVLLEAARRGRNALLLEQKDFAWGTSSRSSKMVHGGLRYIAQGDFRLTRDALQERERMLRELPGLVIRQTYAFLVRQGEFPGRWLLTAVLWLYDFLAGIRDHRWIGRKQLLERLPGLSPDRLSGAMIYTDALTDDARLVFRILHEAAAEGGRLANYMRVESVRPPGARFSLQVRDELSSRQAIFEAATVIDAAGAWAEAVSGEAGKIRPLRGSHLFFERDRLPTDDCITALHPRDKRPVFIFPWAGATVVGTTDLDHKEPLSEEPRCTREELDYLLELIRHVFPSAGITSADVVSAMAGVRPVIASGKGLNPSQESREHSIWLHDGMVCVAGGKLTTFRLIALDALHAAGLIGEAELKAVRRAAGPLFRQKLTFPHGLGHPALPLPQGDALLDTVEWVLRNEMVVHLDDLLLRRVRLGNTMPGGAQDALPQIKGLCQSRLAWDETRWHAETERYLKIVAESYCVPEGTGTP